MRGDDDDDDDDEEIVEMDGRSGVALAGSKMHGSGVRH
jgi:hypothetical protein